MEQLAKGEVCSILGTVRTTSRGVHAHLEIKTTMALGHGEIESSRQRNPPTAMKSAGGYFQSSELER